MDFTVEGAVALVRLNRPPVNALSAELSADLKSAFEEAADPAVRAVVVTGQPHFAAGRRHQGLPGGLRIGWQRNDLARTLAETVPGPRRAWRSRPSQRSTAMPSGAVWSFRLELTFGSCPRMPWWANPRSSSVDPGCGRHPALARVVGFQKAKDIVFTGRQVPAEEALTMGLADRVYPTETLLEESMRTAAEMATWPTRAIAAAKRALAGGWGRPLEEGMSVEEREFDTSFWTDDAREGVAAFLEKRPADFQGR